MAKFTGQELVDYIYYKKLPELYRNYDAEYTDKKDLYRYLKATLTSGFDETLDLAAKMTNLVDPWKCPVEFLPYLYASWGLPYFEDIGEYYNRKFLANICEVLKRRGTYGGIKYLVRVLTGMESDLSYERVITDNETSRKLTVRPVFPTVESLNDVEITSYVIQRFLEMHIPFYIRTIFFPQVEPQNLETDIFNFATFVNVREDDVFFDRTRKLSIDNYFSLSGLTVKNQDLGVAKKNWLETDINLVNAAWPKTEYDMTGLTGDKKPIDDDYIKRASFKLRLERLMANPVMPYSFYDFTNHAYRASFVVPQNIGKQLTDVRAYDLTDVTKQLRTGVVNLVNFMDYSEQDLTWLKGEKIPIDDFIDRTDYLSLESAYLLYPMICEEQDLTWLKGEKHSLIDPAELYEESEELPPLERNFALHDYEVSKEYDLSKEADKQGIIVSRQNAEELASVISHFDATVDKEDREKILSLYKATSAFMGTQSIINDLTEKGLFVDLELQKGYTMNMTGILHRDFCVDRVQNLPRNRYRLPVNFEVKRYDLINI